MPEWFVLALPVQRPQVAWRPPGEKALHPTTPEPEPHSGANHKTRQLSVSPTGFAAAGFRRSDAEPLTSVTHCRIKKLVLHLRHEELPLCSTSLAEHVRNEAGRGPVARPFRLTDDIRLCDCETCRMSFALLQQDDAFVELLKVLTERERRTYVMCKREAESSVYTQGLGEGAPALLLERMQSSGDALELSIRKWLHRIRKYPVLA